MNALARILKAPWLATLRHEQGSISVIAERKPDGNWRTAASLFGARIDTLGLADPLVEIVK